jgi:2-polyprenyl-3-methyl-5-hydroxy-6-metoxy-1,4-benzoquinol methylase
MSNFDRTINQNDPPKLEGCFTRGSLYRWNIYQPYLATLPVGAEVLDVGCGSLKETHYLASRGFHTTGSDLNAERLEEFRQRYCWSNVHPPSLRVASFQQLADEGKRFDAITAFDVIEHLDTLDKDLRELLKLLKPGGFLLISTPNGRSLTEIYSWIMTRIIWATGRKLDPGVPHLQTHTPAGWRKRFEHAGYEVREWDMVIGPLANSFNLLLAVPIQTLLMALQLLRFIGREKRHSLYERLISRINGTGVSRGLKAMDDRTKVLTKGLFTWNLIVLRAPSE